jgi:hypothetical protein
MAKQGSVLSVSRNGLQLTLTDGSRWDIAVGDHTLTLIWTPTARVTIEDSPEDELYPYRITNLARIIHG